MKRLIAAALTATTLTLAACTATAGTNPSTTAGLGASTSPVVSTASHSTGLTAPDSIASWLSGTTSTNTPPISSAPVSDAATVTSESTIATSTGTPGDMYDAIPVTIPATFTGAGLKAANAAIPVWRNAMRVFDESLEDPGGKDWKTAIYRYANDPAALKQMALINTFAKQGIHQVGETGYTAEVVGAVEHNVQIKACVDLSKYDAIDADGHSVLKQGTPSRFTRTFSVSFYYGHSPELWLLNDITTPDPVAPC